MAAADRHHAKGRSKFVILQHDHPFLHWDLLMQHGGVLKSWRLLGPVILGRWIAAEALPDHRLHYLDYEGPISANRGTVVRITSGRFAAGQLIDSHTQIYDLFDCDLATQASFRNSDSGQPLWCFE